ncbi:MAG: flagellar hook-length control protein FliK [Alphaproteobacteria bacterium]|nr:flagellar hook-length control protein FliK [Alphaproteobacteria bacterium]
MLINIPLINTAGAGGLAPQAANGAGFGDVFGLLNQIFGQIAPPDGATPDITQLEEKISALLQKLPEEKKQQLPALLNLLQPDTAQTENLTPETALKKIVALFEAAPAKDGTPQIIRPSLIRDLVTTAAPVIQSTQETTPHTTQAVKLLNALEQFAKETLHSTSGDTENTVPKAEETPAPSATENSLTPETQASAPGPDVQLAEIIIDVLAAHAESDVAPGIILNDIRDHVAALGITPATLQKQNVNIDSTAETVNTTSTPEKSAHKNLISLLNRLQNTAQPQQAQAQADIPETTQQHIPQVVNPAAAPDIATDENVMTFASRTAPTPQVSQKTEQKPSTSPKTTLELAAPPPQNTAEAKAQPAQSTAPKLPAHLSFINMMGENILPDATLEHAEGRPFQLQADLPDVQTFEASAKSLQFVQTTGSRAAHSPTLHMISLQLQKNAQNKVDHMTLQLEPADLGRLEIEMTFGKDGSLKAHLTADKADTFAMLQRDAGHLHRILEEAGFDLDDSALSFDLRQDNPQQQQSAHNDSQNTYGDAQGFDNVLNGDSDMAAQAAAATTHMTGYITPTGVNIMV